MSSMVCRGVQSCFEPLLFEPCGLRNKFILPKPNQCPQNPLTLEQHQNKHQGNLENQDELDNKNKNSKNNSDQENKNNDNTGGWSFIQSLAKKNEETSKDEKEYVHPLVKKSSSVLSLKSLEMCTESLGSETGSDEFSFPLSPKNNKDYRDMWRLKYESFNKKASGNNSFPPPLSSISGSGSVQVTPHREGGRLVLKAAAVSSSNSSFQAERVDGCLKLRLVEDNLLNCDEDGQEEEEEEEEVEYEDDDENWDEDLEGNSENVEDEMGIGERPMPRRCKESGHENKGMPNWEPCWVAIS